MCVGGGAACVGGGAVCVGEGQHGVGGRGQHGVEGRGSMCGGEGAAWSGVGVTSNDIDIGFQLHQRNGCTVS